MSISKQLAVTARAPGSPWINVGALENSRGAAAGKCQSVTPKAADEGRQVVSSARGLQDLQYLQSFLNMHEVAVWWCPG